MNINIHFRFLSFGFILTHFETHAQGISIDDYARIILGLLSVILTYFIIIS
jgi:hypothetical protein